MMTATSSVTPQLADLLRAPLGLIGLARRPSQTPRQRVCIYLRMYDAYASGQEP